MAVVSLDEVMHQRSVAREQCGVDRITVRRTKTSYEIDRISLHGRWSLLYRSCHSVLLRSSIRATHLDRELPPRWFWLMDSSATRGTRRLSNAGCVWLMSYGLHEARMHSTHVEFFVSIARKSSCEGETEARWCGWEADRGVEQLERASLNLFFLQSRHRTSVKIDESNRNSFDSKMMPPALSCQAFQVLCPIRNTRVNAVSYAHRCALQEQFCRLRDSSVTFVPTQLFLGVNLSAPVIKSARTYAYTYQLQPAGRLLWID